MFVLVLAAEADETRQAVTLLIVCLVGIAILLAALTVWYWMFTSPKRRADRLLTDLGHYAPGPHEPEVRISDVAADELVVMAGDDLAIATVAAGDNADIDLAGLASPTVLLESSDLMSAMMIDPDEAAPAKGQAEQPAVLHMDRTDVAEGIPQSGENSDSVAAEPVEPFRRVVASKRAETPARPDLRVSAEPKTIRSGGPKPAEAPGGVRGSRRVDPTVARPTTSGAAAKANPAREEPPATKPTESGRIEVAARPSVRAPQPTGTTDAAPHRPAETTQDELAKLRQRRGKQEEQEGLSDDDWAAVMKSAFNHLNR